MIVLVYLIVLLRELLVSTIFCMVRPYIAIHSFLHLLDIFYFFCRKRIYAHAHVNAEEF